MSDGIDGFLSNLLLLLFAVIRCQGGNELGGRALDRGEDRLQVAEPMFAQPLDSGRGLPE